MNELQIFNNKEFGEIRTVERGNGLPLETKTTKVTGKGQIYFIQKILAS